ncbi:hypothetical protein JY97_04470 [Alkalispirochaeta odontotermitis]|nr:hypothetical protein JY97_04470 [Alkalispirochaeta odontotermitis]CAB1081017.1 hypothetical protein D1AOALGA4SA_8682 [Olavius algarvensis Delta 1 endosymbiont]
MRNRDEIEALLEKALGQSNAPLAQVEYFFRQDRATRFGENAITQCTGGAEKHLRLVLAYGKHHGSSATNKLDDGSIGALVNRAEKIAAGSPADPEFMPPVASQPPPAVPPRYDEKVARLTPAAIAAEIATAVEMAKGLAYKASGLFAGGWGARAIANSEGHFAFERFSNLNHSITMHGPLGSGYAAENAEFIDQINTESMARRALETAEKAQNPVPIEPGDYTVVFEPRAVADLLSYMAWNMSARDADEGTTVFAAKVGERLFNPMVRIETRVDDPELPAPPFGQDGLPARPMVWVNGGVVERLRHDRYWASQKETRPDPLLYPLFMDGQDQNLQDLIVRCQKGLLVKRLWYIRYVDRKSLLLTGMTRDGVFLIENGRIIHPVSNLRFNESPVAFLQNVVAMSRPQRVEDWAKVPGMMSESFTFSSKTESV